MLCGFLFGTACLIGLAKMIHHGRCGYGYGHGGYGGGGCGGGGGGGGACGGRWHRGWHGHHGQEHGHGRHGFGKRAALRWLFERLDTTPGQEKVILDAVEEMKEPISKARNEWRGSIGEFGKAVRGAELDHTAIAEAWTKHDRGLEAVRMAIVAQLDRIHEALDDHQRKILADLIEQRSGWWGVFGGGENNGGGVEV